MHNPFTDHPHRVGETYFEHLSYAAKSGVIMMLAGFANLIHALFPFLFATTWSDTLIALLKKYIQRVPVLDERIIALDDCIEVRKHQPKAAS